jgi:glutathione S-transferase
VLLLTIDPQRLAAAALEVRFEQAGGGESFPHLYGPLPLGAVLRAEPWLR